MAGVDALCHAQYDTAFFLVAGIDALCHAQHDAAFFDGVACLIVFLGLWTCALVSVAMRRRFVMARWGLLLSIAMTRRKNIGWVRRLVRVVLGCAAAAVLVVAGTNIAVVAMSQAAIVDEQKAASYDADAIVVLGASVLPDGTPSSILQDRIDDGIALYFAGAAPKIIMSGDNATVSYNEVKAMKEYAIAQGVPSEDIFCDHAGFSTYETMYRAKHVFGTERIVVATQTYHLYRAVYDANALGVEAIGVPSDYRTYSGQLQYDIREVFARTKDFFMTIFETPSTYVGDAISLDQSGDITN